MSIQGPGVGKVALVTGGASGIGLSVVEDLAAQGWNITIVDINAELSSRVAERLREQVYCIRAETGDYDQQARAFAESWKRWSRLDFVFANAGHGDRIDFYEPAKVLEDGSPLKPDISVVNTNLDGVIYTAYLAIHYFRKNVGGAGKLVCTGSMLSVYHGPYIPLYTASKHGVLGFVRSIAQHFRETGEPITVNCLMPAIVDTGMTNQILGTFANERRLTPHSTILRAVNSFIQNDSATGQAIECSVGKLHYHESTPYADDDSRWAIEFALKDITGRAYQKVATA